MNEAFAVVVRINLQSGNSRRFSFEFDFKADTRAQVEQCLAEVAETVKRLPRGTQG
jgi:hypothetical protein